MLNRLPLLALLLAPVLAQADERERPAAFPRGEETCFGRVYDADHLKAHPDQTVTSFFLWHELSQDPLVEWGDETSAGKKEWDDDPDNPLLLNLMMHVRDRPDQQVQQFECHGGDGSIFCGVDCDGGYFTAKADGDKLTVTNEGFQFEGVCESGFGWLDPGKDDKVFALDKMPASVCAAERESGRPSLAEAGPPLSTTLDGPEPACYEASYDDAHLAANAAQSVTDIWLVKRGEDDFHLGVCQRGGDCAEAEVACSPNTYSWACISPEFDRRRDFRREHRSHVLEPGGGADARRQGHHAAQEPPRQHGEAARGEARHRRRRVQADALQARRLQVDAIGAPARIPHRVVLLSASCASRRGCAGSSSPISTIPSPNMIG